MKLLLTVGTVIALSWSCVNDRTKIGIEIELPQNASKGARATNSKDLHDRFSELVSKNSHLEPITGDVQAILSARSLEERRSLQEAILEWKKAVNSARGGLGDVAFKGWVNAYTAELGKKIDSVVLARLILSDAGIGAGAPFLKSQGLNREGALVTYLERMKNSLIVPQFEQVRTDDSLAVLPPPSAGVPAEDILLLKAAAQNCKAGSKSEPWVQWGSSLPSEIQDYWVGIVASCSGKNELALERLTSAYEKLKGDLQWSHLSLEAVNQIILIYRAQGNRLRAADAYIWLMENWGAVGESSPLIAADRQGFYLRRVNDALWAARYRALVGDWENAKIYAHQALDYVSDAYIQLPGATKKAQETLVENKVEAYHTLAFRIALEKGELDSALALTVLALQTQNIPAEWSDRLRWDLGFYEYLRDRKAEALQHWDSLANETKSDSMKARLLFWRKAANQDLGRAEEGERLRGELARKFPLSYYNIVAGNLANSPDQNKVGDFFGAKESLEKRLRKSANLDLTSISQHLELLTDFQRAEAAIESGASDLAELILADLQKALHREFEIQINPEPFIYFSRLLYANGQFNQSIVVTSKLLQVVPEFWAKWPEQLLVFFPLPYHEMLVKNSAESKIEVAMLAAVIRQESAFNSKAQSPANAMGLMQLIRPTAIRLADGSGVSQEDAKSKLQDPEINIRLGSRYLRELAYRYAGSQAMVAAAYNAGEFAADAWKLRRNLGSTLVWIELVPFGETQDYVKNVWRNLQVYRFLDGRDDSFSQSLVGARTESATSDY